MHGMGVRTRGFVPQAVGIGGAVNSAGAHGHAMRGGGSEGPKPPHLRHIHMDGDMGINMKESRNSTPRGFGRSSGG